MIKELNHIGIRTADMEASINFYTGALGGTVVRDATSTDGKSRFVYIQIVDGIIELITSGKEEEGLAHIAFIVDDKLDDCYKQLVEMGYTFTVAPKVAGSGDGRLAFFKDSSGCMFELIERETGPRPTYPNDVVREFDHLSVRVNDSCVDRCEEFYLNTMGFQTRRILRKGDNVMSYYFHGKDTYETLYAPGVTSETALQHLAFRVDDAAATKAYLESKGVLCPHPVKTSQMGNFQILNIIGPDNVAIEFVDRPSLDDYNG